MIDSESNVQHEVDDPLIDNQKEEKKESKRISKTKKPSSRGKIKKLQEEIKSLKEDKEKLNDKILRIAAEFDNYKKLISKEVENRIRNASEMYILDFLPVLDDLQRTLDSVSDDDKSNPIVGGVQMIRDNMKQVLNKYGVEEIESVGKEFNVEIHEALMTASDEKYPSDYVVQEHQKGYKQNSRVIRPAKVTVNKID